MTGTAVAIRLWCRDGPIGVTLLVVLVWALASPLVVTGDEPGYIYHAFSFFARGDFVMPQAAFHAAFPTLANVPMQDLQTRDHPVLFAVLASPLVGWFGVAGARAASLIAGLLGLLAVHALVRETAGSKVAAVVSLFVFVTVPVLAYLQLFYTDMASLALVAWAWRLARSPSLRGVLADTVLATCLPFIHIRTSLIAAGLFGLVLVRIAQGEVAGVRRARAAALVLSIGALAGSLFVWHQIALYGSLIGGASTPYATTAGSFAWRTGIQLLDFRHGLLTLDPAMILAFAGLAIGLVRGSRPALEALGLLALYTVSFVWGTASESYPARLWLPIVPALAVGLGVWLAHVRGPVALAAGGVLASVSLLDATVYLCRSRLFLGSRQASLVYDGLFGKFGHLDLAGLLPWDAFNYTDHGLIPHMEISADLMTGAAGVAGLLVVAFVLEACVPRGCGRATRLPAAVLPAFVLIVPIWFAALRAVPQAAMQVARSRGDSARDGSIAIAFCGPVDARLIRILGQNRALMQPPAYPAEFRIEARGDPARPVIIRGTPTSPVVVLPGGPVRTLLLSGHTDRTHRGWVDDPVEVLMKGTATTCR